MIEMWTNNSNRNLSVHYWVLFLSLIYKQLSCDSLF